MTPVPLSNENVGGALLAASAAASLALSLIIVAQAPKQASWLMLPMILAGFMIAVLHSAILALLAYTLMCRWWPLTWWNAGLAGALIGALPAGLLTGSLHASTAAGTSGSVGGFIFWFVLRGPRSKDDVA